MTSRPISRPYTERMLLTTSILALTAVALLNGCSKLATNIQPNYAPLVTAIEVHETGAPPASAAQLANVKAQAALSDGLGPVALDTTTGSASPMLSAHVTLAKASLLNRVFLYGSDLQYSSIPNGGLSLIVQSESTGHTPIYFRILDDQLQMLADQRNQFESDVDHPERLINTFPILSQDATTLTIDVAQASPVLNTVVTDSKAAPPRTTWVRSVQYVNDGQYFMYETSIEMADGTIAEFMETFFPRDTVIPADAKPVYNDPSLEPLSKRYRFLDSGSVWADVAGQGRQQTKIASRFNSTPGKPIQWYITPNIPAEYLPVIKDAVEGWNRYSQKMYAQDIVHFAGTLPTGIKIGDPRYNVINWDSVAQAGAAYESQAADPFTGIQTHSLIYLPKAWVNIGQDYWQAGGVSDDIKAQTEAFKTVAKRGTFLGQKLPIHCMQDPFDQVSLDARVDPATFSKGLLRGVLFHEMGHSLGLAHNFKGSLSFDPGDPKSSFSTSIMDYNQYQLEEAAFDAQTGSTGPLLEYDRQILSVLYNGGKDVAKTDATLPACEDSESDSEVGGVDPLCIRYDSGHDPSQELVTTVALTKDEAATNRTTQSLPLAIKLLTSELGDATALKSSDDVKTALQAKLKALSGIELFYFASGAQSLAYSAQSNVRSLKEYKSGILPDGYNENAMRTRAIQGVRYIANLEAFEAATEHATELYKTAVHTWIGTSAYLATQASDAQDASVKALAADFDTSVATLEQTVLSKTRKGLFKGLPASSKAPYDLFTDATGNTVDFEDQVAKILSQAATTTSVAGNIARPLDERIEAAKALVTFKGTVSGDAYLTQAIQTVKNEAHSARDLTSRNNALQVYQALTTAAALPAGS